MSNILSSRIIKIEPANGGNKVYLLVTARSKRAAKRRARLEASNIILIRNQRNIIVEQVQRIEFYRGNTGIEIKSGVITTENRTIENVKSVDVEAVYNTVLRQFRDIRLDYVDPDENQPRDEWVSKEKITNTEGTRVPVLVRTSRRPQQIMFSSYDDSYIVIITEE